MRYGSKPLGFVKGKNAIGVASQADSLRKVLRAKGEIFNLIGMFYNPIKRHSHTGGVSSANSAGLD